MNVTRYQQSSWYYIGSPMNVSLDMERKEKDLSRDEKDLSCDNQWTRNRNK